MCKWSAQEKAKIVLEVLTGQKTVAEACRAYAVSESVYYRWQLALLENAHLAFGSDCRYIQELERLAGQMALELEVPPPSPPSTPSPPGAPERPLLPAQGLPS